MKTLLTFYQFYPLLKPFLSITLLLYLVAHNVYVAHILRVHSDMSWIIYAKCHQCKIQLNLSVFINNLEAGKGFNEVVAEVVRRNDEAAEVDKR